jgi:hypothetical protein
MWRVFFWDYKEVFVNAPDRQTAISMARFISGKWITTIISASKVSDDK